MLDEKSLRRPTFTEGYGIKLADGQTWVFPRPRLRFFPKFKDGQWDVAGGASFGPEFDGQLDILMGVREATAHERFKAKFEMAARLLLANYELQPDDVSTLVVLEPGDPESDDRWDQLLNVLAGNAPKPTADTSDAAA